MMVVVSSIFFFTCSSSFSSLEALCNLRMDCFKVASSFNTIVFSLDFFCCSDFSKDSRQLKTSWSFKVLMSAFDCTTSNESDNVRKTFLISCAFTRGFFRFLMHIKKFSISVFEDEMQFSTCMSNFILHLFSLSENDSTASLAISDKDLSPETSSMVEESSLYSTTLCSKTSTVCLNSSKGLAICISYL